MIFFRRFAVHVVFDILILLIVPFVKKIFWKSLPDSNDCIREKKCFGSPVLKYSYHDSSVFASKTPKLNNLFRPQQGSGGTCGNKVVTCY